MEKIGDMFCLLLLNYLDYQTSVCEFFVLLVCTDGPCALDFSKMKTPDSYWSDPTADELVQRHRIHSGLFQQTPATTTSQRPQLGAARTSYDENLAVAPLLAREHIESLHQNSHAALLYGKNNVYLEPVSKFLNAL